MCFVLLTYLLTPWSTGLPEKLVSKFPAFYGTRRFITAFTTARHLSLSWARSIQFMPFQPISLRSILILSFHIYMGLSSGLLPSGFPTSTLYARLLSPYVLHALPISVFFIWSPEWYLVRTHKAPHYVVFSVSLLLRACQAQISSSALYSRKPSACVPPSM